MWLVKLPRLCLAHRCLAALHLMSPRACISPEFACRTGCAKHREACFFFFQIRSELDYEHLRQERTTTALSSLVSVVHPFSRRF